MDTKQLITFVTFAKEKSYIKTAMKLNYAPATLAEHITVLERELQVKLVESHGKRSTLTNEGKVFLAHAKKILEDYRIACEEMKSMTTIGGTLTLLTIASLGRNELLQILQQYIRKFPQVDLALQVTNYDTILEKIRSREADLAYTFCCEEHELEGIETIVLDEAELKFVCWKGHPLTRKKIVYPEDLKNQVFIRAQKGCYYHTALNRMLKKNHVEIKSTLQVDDSDIMKSYVRMGYGLALFTENTLKEEFQTGEICALPWGGDTIKVYTKLLIPQKAVQSHAVKEFINVMKQYHEKESG